MLDIDCMGTNSATPQQQLIDAASALASDSFSVLELDPADRKAMAGSLMAQLEAHIDGRVTRHPDTFQQQLKVIEHGVRRAAAPSLLANLEDMVVNGAPAGRNAAGISGGSAGSKAPLYVPSLDIADSIRATCRTGTSRITGRPTALRSAHQPLVSSCGPTPPPHSPADLKNFQRLSAPSTAGSKPSSR